ncbi:MAG: nickel pincer cofactor biosynthesis protein LarC [Armatimonadota bacterium]
MPMRVAYLEPIGGLSGDMMLGALVDCGLAVEALGETVRALGIAEEVAVSARPAVKSGIAATKVDVHAHGHHGHHDYGHGHHHGRSAAELIAIVEAADLDAAVIERSVAIIRRLAEAEARVHATTPEQVHFHELGGLDTLVDVVGAVVGLRALGVERLHCAPLPIGHGWIECAHGRLPVPAPATAELLVGVPTREVDVCGETVTPTGAALVVTLADGFERPADLLAQRIGYGAGNADFDPVPNLVRLWLSAELPRAAPEPREAGRVTIIETNVDDMPGELAPGALDAALAAGALDAWIEPIIMKKGRPALLIRALCVPERADAVAEALLRETTSLGVRLAPMERRCLRREQVTVKTAYGPISVKVGYLAGRPITASPEYEDCRRAASEHGVPLKEVYAAATAAARPQG